MMMNDDTAWLFLYTLTLDSTQVGGITVFLKLTSRSRMRKVPVSVLLL